jgi:hypothetical protein
MLTLPEPHPSSNNSVSPMEVSPGSHGNMAFSYSENNILQNSFSTMPSFSGSQESRHGRQRKFTQKAQAMFKENKLGPGRPSNHHFQSSSQFSSSTGTSEQQQHPQQHIQSSPHLPQFNTSSNITTNHQSLSHVKPETPHPIASSSYSFPQDYPRLPQPTSQQQQQFTFSFVNNSHQNNQQQHVTPGAPQMPLQQHHQNAAATSFQAQQQQPFFRSPGQQVRLTMPNGNNIDGDGNEEDEDDREWCFCGEHSYGEMIACENQNCPYKWFHYQCVGINRPPTGKWYCAECLKTLGIRS